MGIPPGPLRMANATPDIRLLFQPQSVIVLWPVPSLLGDRGTHVSVASLRPLRSTRTQTIELWIYRSVNHKSDVLPIALTISVRSMDARQSIRRATCRA